MTIISVRKEEDGTLIVTRDNGKDPDSVPDDFDNSDRVLIKEWVDTGGVIDLYIAPLPPTDKERVDSIFNGSDANTTMLETLFKLHNRVLVLEGKPAINLPSFRQLFEERLPK